MKTEQELMKQNVLHSRLAFVGGVLAAPVMAFFAPILVAMEIENNNLRLIGYSPSAREVNAEYRKRLAIFFKEYVIKLPSHTYNRVFNNGMAKIQDLHKKNELEITKNFQDTVNSIMESDFADMYVKLLSAKKIDLQYFEKTEHQPATLEKCIFDEYHIAFSGIGTEWCGGIHGNTYVSKNDNNGGYKHIAALNNDQSKCVYDAAEWRYKQLKLGGIIGSIKR